jgi:hypothetical protein
VRLGMRPPGVPASYDECGVATKALILAFHQFCEHDEAEMMAATRIM